METEEVLAVNVVGPGEVVGLVGLVRAEATKLEDAEEEVVAKRKTLCNNCIFWYS